VQVAIEGRLAADRTGSWGRDDASVAAVRDSCIQRALFRTEAIAGTAEVRGR